MLSTKNFAEYRESLHMANPPCIPFFGEFIWRQPLKSNFLLV